MKKLRKIGAIVLAVMMIAVVGIAWAGTAGDVYQDDSQTAVSGNTIPLTKAIVMFNINGSDVYEPNISYTYSVAPVTTATLLGNITDDGENNNNTPVTVKVNAGETDGVYFATGANTISYSSNNTIITTDADGVEVEKSTSMTVDLSKFTHAGVYRYKITEADNGSAVTAAGMVRGADYSRERYLDIYLSNGGTVDATTNPAGLQLSGAVIFKTDAQDTSDPVNDATDQITTTTYKTTGFEPGVNSTDGEGNVDYTSDTESDHYTTYDIIVSKTVTGGLADKTHEFPFYVSITNSITDAKYTYTDDTNTSAAETIASASITKGSDDKNSTLTLKDGESITFVGVPTNQASATPLSIDVHEYNDANDQYTASVAVTNGDAPTLTNDQNASSGVMQALNGSVSLSTFVLPANDVVDQEIAITNNLSSISPTGYVARFAPYALILIGGIALLIIARKHRKHTDEE